ncbi:MAG: hypothetical protein DRZ76_03980 [Candidatus Nealsonbacteria bacterium]|nr:MAG: hypothetical protein DRZ76_03980 [Candidatus Nealsonbacteria bacterium]
MGRPLRSDAVRQSFRDTVVCGIEFAPLAPDPDYFKTSTNLSDQTTTLAAASMTASVAPQWPVVPVLVITNDKASGEESWTGVSATILGYDQFGELRPNTVDAVNSSDTWTATFTRAYCSLKSITFTVTGGTDVDSSDSYVLGFAKTYGLGQNIARSADVLIHNFDGAADDGTISTVYGTYTIDGTPDGSKLLNLYVRSTSATG